MSPDVSVIVAVYNTMPYLTECLASLADQTIGHDRMEIITVDDGSTDGSDKELERFASLYPGLFTVIHQPHSGGPAAPSNRGLAFATGRYIHFVGADDYLGPEALERLVAAADAWGSDVVAGKMTGVNGRHVDQRLFDRDARDVTFARSALPWALSNCKLFRRSMVGDLRFPETMRAASDQPFTIEACTRARLISVLASYPCYHAVKRADESNITYDTQATTLLGCVTELFDHTTALLDPGPALEAVRVRHFSWELARLLRRDFLGLDRPVQERLCAGIGRLVDEHLSAAIMHRISAWRRVRLLLAQRGEVDLLCELLRTEAEHGPPPTVVERDRVFAAYPGFRTVLPDGCFELRGDLARRLGAGLRTVSATRSAGGIALRVRVPLAGDPGAAGIDLLPSERGAGRVTSILLDGTVIAEIPLERLLDAGRHAVRLVVRAGGRAYDLPVPATDQLEFTGWRGFRAFRVSFGADQDDHMIITVQRVGVVRALLRRS